MRRAGRVVLAVCAIGTVLMRGALPAGGSSESRRALAAAVGGRARASSVAGEGGVTEFARWPEERGKTGVAGGSAETRIALAEAGRIALSVDSARRVTADLVAVGAVVVGYALRTI